MKVRNRKTREIVDIIAWSQFINRGDADYVSYIDSKGVEHDTEKGLNYYWDFEPIEDASASAINWEQRRYEIAKAAMQGILSNEDEVEYSCSEAIYGERKHTIPIAIAQFALACANALIKELKEE